MHETGPNAPSTGIMRLYVKDQGTNDVVRLHGSCAVN